MISFVDKYRAESYNYFIFLAVKKRKYPLRMHREASAGIPELEGRCFRGRRVASELCREAADRRYGMSAGMCCMPEARWYRGTLRP